jgi:protease I
MEAKSGARAGSGKARGIGLPLAGLRVGFLAQNDVEEMHLWVPRCRLEEEGATCFVIGHDKPYTYLGAHGIPVEVDEGAWRIDPGEIAAFVVPGGLGADLLRLTPDVRSIIRYGFLLGKVVAAVERGTWVLISAGIAKGKAVAGPRHLWGDLENAGARVIDEGIVVDGNLITARDTEALPGFCRALVAALAKVAAVPPAARRGAPPPRGSSKPWRS